MKDLTTRYLGLELEKPDHRWKLRVDRLPGEQIKELAEADAGAIVLKSLFEEQIEAELRQNIDTYQDLDYPDAYDYVRQYTRDSAVTEYLELISDVKKAADIPMIASLNCISAAEWTSFARKLRRQVPMPLKLISACCRVIPESPAMTEKIYFDVLDKVTEDLTIPVALKMSSYSSSLANLVSRLCWTGKVNGFVLFNRYFRPDIDINRMALTSAGIYSDPSEISTPLRWIALLSGMVDCDLAGSTGVHDSEGAIKMLLAGAAAVQVVSSLYKGGVTHATELSGVLKPGWKRTPSAASMSSGDVSVINSTVISRF